MTELEPLDPTVGKQMYLDQRRTELAERTLESHHYRLKQFIQWCISNDIDNLNDVDARVVHDFRVKRRDEDKLAPASMRGQMATLRAFTFFLASINAVSEGLSEKIILPKTTEEDVRDEMISPELAKSVLDYLNKFHYATLEHALWETLWNTGVRLGGAVGTDKDDFDNQARSLTFLHRPAKGTPLKNKSKGERAVALSKHVTNVLEDWLSQNHPGHTDEYGRTPLFATSRGRLSRTHARRMIYHFCKPCVRENECPHDEDIDECEFAPMSRSSSCPSARSPHTLRRGAITYHLREDTPKQVCRERMDCSETVNPRASSQGGSRMRFEIRRSRNSMKCPLRNRTSATEFFSTTA